ncbi:MAG: hypothetical protein WAM70_01170 [Pyrinomonadaceae bacterium]
MDPDSIAGIKIIEGIGSVLRKSGGRRENDKKNDKGESAFHWDVRLAYWRAFEISAFRGQIDTTKVIKICQPFWQVWGASP